MRGGNRVNTANSINSVRYLSEAKTVLGHAKINLHLDVVGREENGYHLVDTVMQSLSLCDEVSVRLTESGFVAHCDVEGVPTDEKNIAVKAAMLFMKELGRDVGAEITIKKNIPMAAGMAGGSADGAATLVALNGLCGMPFSEAELCALGAKLGADVPFCVKGGTAFADGRGDILHEFPKMPDCHIVAACGGEGVSTPWAYGMLDEKYNGFGNESGYVPKGTAGLFKAMNKENVLLSELGKELYNIFEEPILERRPVAKMIKQTIVENGAVAAMMSGSGPSVFGIFDNKSAALATAEKLSSMGVFATVCRPE